jgi:hypothetical protein
MVSLVYCVVCLPLMIAVDPNVCLWGYNRPLHLTQSYNSGIFVILKQIVNLELQVTFIKQPVFAGP